MSGSFQNFINRLDQSMAALEKVLSRLRTLDNLLGNTRSSYDQSINILYRSGIITSNQRQDSQYNADQWRMPPTNPAPKDNEFTQPWFTLQGQLINDRGAMHDHADIAREPLLSLTRLNDFFRDEHREAESNQEGTNALEDGRYKATSQNTLDALGTPLINPLKVLTDALNTFHKGTDELPQMLRELLDNNRDVASYSGSCARFENIFELPYRMVEYDDYRFLEPLLGKSQKLSKRTTPICDGLKGAFDKLTPHINPKYYFDLFDRASSAVS